LIAPPARRRVALRLSFFVRPKGPFLRPDLPPAGRRAQQPSRVAGTLRVKHILRFQATLDGGEHGVMLAAGRDSKI